MATVAETVLKISAEDSLKTLKELRAEAQEYRKKLDDMKVGSTEFSEAQAKLSQTLDTIRKALSLAKDAAKEEAQAAKEAAKAAAQAAKEEAQAAEYVEGSYNALVKTMSDLTKVWRATGDEAERAKLGEKILEINTQLKALDASRGNFQRNVGNYESAFNGLSTSMSQVLRELPSLQMGMSTFVLAISNNLPILFDNIQRVNAELAAMRKNGEQVPSTMSAILKSFLSVNTAIMAGILILQLVVNNWDKIASLWRDKSPEEIAKEAIEEMNEAIERQAQIIEQQNIEALRQYTAELRAAGGDADTAREALDKYTESLRANALAQAEASRALAAERAQSLKKDLIDAEIRLKALERRAQVGSDIGASMYSTKAVEDARQALEDLRKAYDEANAQLQKYVGDVAKEENDIAKAESDRAIKVTENAQKAEEEHQKELARLEELKAKYEEAVYKDWDKIRREFVKYSEEHSFIRLPDLSEFDDWAEDYINKGVEANEKFFRNLKKAKEREKELEEKTLKARKALAVDAFAQLMGSTSQLFEENTVAHKAFAIAEATISTYAAAAKSFEQLGGWPLGLVGIASSIAAGLVQVKNIMSVDTSGKNTNVALPSAPAIVSAPAVVQEVPITRTMLDVEQEDRLNASLQDQRVYVVYSDIEGAGKRVDVQRAESSF